MLERACQALQRRRLDNSRRGGPCPYLQIYAICWHFLLSRDLCCDLVMHNMRLGEASPRGHTNGTGVCPPMASLLPTRVRNSQS